MADFYPTAGCRFYIGPVMATQAGDLDESDFITSPPKVYTEVDGWSSMGSVGDVGDERDEECVTVDVDVEIADRTEDRDDRVDARRADCCLCQHIAG
jgi:hypothetical protein